MDGNIFPLSGSDDAKTLPIYDTKMGKIEILGVQHDYELTLGQTDSDLTVVFVHGWLLSQQYWRPIIAQVRSQFPCLSYDLRGFGNSNLQSHTKEQNHFQLKGTEPAIAKLASERCKISHFSPAAFGRDLLLLLNALGIQRAWLVGHSLGGTIALWAAAMAGQQDTMLPPHSPQIEGVTCLNSGGGIYVKEEFKKFRQVGQQILSFRPQWLSKVPGIDWVFSHSNVASAVNRYWGQQLLEDFLRVNQEAGKRALLDSTTSEEVLLLPSLVQQIEQPTYFLAGDKDQVMAPKFVHHLASFHPSFQAGSNVFELENCGHLGMIEQSDQVSKLILDLIFRHRAT